MKVNIWPINLSTTVTKLDIFALDLPTTANNIVRAIAEQILYDSDHIPPMVPVGDAHETGVMEGALRDSGRVEKAKGGWAVVYGGNTDKGFVDYANQVHDDLRERKYTRSGSGPKFVETHYIRRTEAADGDFTDTINALVERLFGA